MLVSCIYPFRLLKYHQQIIKTYSRCFVLSNISYNSSSSDKNLKDQIKKPDDNNEWLWTYLRDRKTFPDLSEEQRRRVVEIG